MDKYGISRRSQLEDEDIMSIFDIQCNYFRQNKRQWHPFFLPFVKLLDGIKVGDQPISFSSGDVCFVDAIKCPTQKAWMGFVMTSEGKKVWDNCLRKKNKYLVRQLEIHKPRVVLFYGTAGLVSAKKRGIIVNKSQVFSENVSLVTRHLSCEGKLKQVSLDISNTKIGSLSATEMKKVRAFISEAVHPEIR